MKVLKIDKSQWAAGLAQLEKDYRLFGPQKKGKFHEFCELENGTQPDLKFGNTRMSAKQLIYPQSEVMFEYNTDESQENHHQLQEPATDYRPRAVMGIRPCDAAAFLLVQRNFDTPEYKDPYWIKAYEATTLVGLACQAPCHSCFCTTAGCGPFHEEGLDVLLAEDGDALLVKAITAKGQKLVSTAGWETEDGQGDERLAQLKQTAEDKITSTVQTDKLKDKASMELYEAPFWEDVAFACITCGTCTYLCPTCWCFDIQDENRGSQGVRMRNWDSCMFPLFSLHGSGHNPRGVKVQRVRQRFMHKLKYYVDKYQNGIQCVGCGRCVKHCPVNIDIRKVCDLMNAYEAEPAPACPVS